jgi:hypothetical protein
MYLHIHIDTSYLSEAKARSRVGDTFFLNSKPHDPSTAPSPTNTPPPYNDTIHTISSIMRNIMAYSTETELGAIFQNAHDYVHLRIAFEEMRQLQAATPIQTDNACPAGIVNDIGMHFYWICERIKQGQFIIHWRAGKYNLADCFTKHHYPAHNKLMRSRSLLEVHKPAPT